VPAILAEWEMKNGQRGHMARKWTEKGSEGDLEYVGRTEFRKTKGEQQQEQKKWRLLEESKVSEK